MSATGANRGVSGRRPSIVVVGSVNLDMAASVSRLPSPGETVSGADLRRFPGGKGANQALAARRLGADVTLIARVGRDAEADAALALLEADGVDLSRCLRDAALPTGVALIAIAPNGENLIVVAPGANRALTPEKLVLPAADALMCQLEVPADSLCLACERFDGFFCVNLAPAMQVPQEILRRADLIVVNETEAAFYGDALDACRGMVAITHGAGGAVLSKQRTTIATSTPPQVVPVDTVVYYIAESDTVRDVVNPSLWRVIGSDDPQELIEGVEALQVEYGVDTNGDRIVNEYQDASEVANWDNVMSVTFAVLIRSTQPNAREIDNRTWNLLGTEYGPFEDHFERTIYTTTVTLRNATS